MELIQIYLITQAQPQLRMMEPTMKTTITTLGIPFSFDADGKWEFNDDKTQVSFTETGESTSTNLIILKLASKELKLKEVDGSDVTISTYEPQ